MGFFGTILFLATTGITIYYFPILIYNTPWEDLVAIKNSEYITTIMTAEDANKAFIVSIVVCVIIGVITIASILYSYRRVGK